MNEALIKNSILKKTVKLRDNLNTTPSSGKSVRFHGVEFMLINNNDDDTSERGSFLDDNGEDSSNGRHQHHTLPANTRINLFRMHDATSSSTSNNDGNNARLVRTSYAHPPTFTGLSRGSSRELSTTSNSFNGRKWSQAFTRSGSSSTKPPVYPKTARPFTNPRYIGTTNRNTSSNVSSNTRPATTNYSSSSQQQQQQFTATSNRMNNDQASSMSPLHVSTYPLTSIQSSPNLSLYSYLLQTSNPLGTKEPKDMINPSSIRSQTKRLSCDEINVKPFMPRIQQTINSASNSLRLSQSTPSFQSYLTNPPGSRDKNRIFSNSATPRTPPRGGAGIIHVNTHNLSYLNTHPTASGNDHHHHSDAKHIHNHDGLIMRIAPITASINIA